MNENKKSTTIQSVKTVAVLVIICLVCCLLLSVCNDLFYISDEERFQRSMAKIYPNFVNDESFNGTLNGTYKTNADFGEIKSVARSTDGAYIVEAVGNGGYQGGTVTLYVVVGSDAKILGWTVKENVNQSYINRIPANAGTTWYVGEDVSGDLALNMSGATVVATSTAINHAVNMAAYYCRNALGVGKNPEADALAAVKELLAATDCTLTSKNQLLSATIGKQTVAQLLSGVDDTLSYVFTDEGQGVQAFVYGSDANRKIVVLKNGNAIKTSNGADELVVILQSKPILSFNLGGYLAFAIITSQENDTYTVAGLNIGTVPSTYVLKVKIELSGSGNCGQVKTIEIENNGYLGGSGAPTEGNENNLITSLVGATSETIDSVYDNNKVSGATQSANLITVAVKAALSRFDASLAQ